MNKFALITSLNGFDIAFTKVETTLKQCQDKVVPTLYQCCINIVQNWKTDVVFVSFLTSDQCLFNIDPY